MLNRHVTAVSLAIHVERSSGAVSGATTGRQSTNNILKETVPYPNDIIMTSNNFTNQLFATFKPDIRGKYTVTIYNLGPTIRGCKLSG